MELAKLHVQKLAKNGAFGSGKLIQVVEGTVDGRSVQYVSQVFFLSVEIERNGSLDQVRVAVKIMPDAPLELTHADVQFAREVIMYESILPDIGAYDLGTVPKMYAGSFGNGRDQNSIAFEDLRHQNFKTPEDLFLDYDHVSFALQKLGAFHGISYKMRTSNKDIYSLYNKLPRKIYFDGRELVEGALLRGFKPLIKEGRNASVLEKAHEKLASKASPQLWESLQEPEEPFAVIAHGDFNKNNMLFKYDDVGRVSEVKFIDWAMSGYSDPAVDISFFLYMNTSSELRAEFWDDFLIAYWKGVTSVVENPGFRFDEFLKNFAKRAVYGYVPCSFFLPPMLVPESALSPTTIFRKSPDELRNLGLTFGGEAAMEAVASIVQHLLDKGYLEEYLEHF